MTFSKNGVALIVMVLSLLGAEVSEADMLTTIGVIGQVVSFILMAWNQYARGDVKGFIFKE
jgi:hypothetical protein